MACLVACGSLRPAFGQMDNRAFEERYRVPDSLRYGIVAHSFSFFRNLEYFTPVTDGKTMFGQQLAVRGMLHPTERLTVSGGLYLWKDFGNPVLQQVRPLVTLRYQQGRFAFLFGTLEGQLAHRQIEPLQDFEATVTRRQEEGFQLKYEGPKLWADVWLEWQNMLYRFANDQERFQVGMNIRPVLAEGRAGRLLGIWQYRAWHAGGTLDTTPGRPGATTIMALSPGLRLEDIRWGRSRLMVDGYAILTTGATAYYPEALKRGQGLFLNAQWATPWFALMASYWQGRGFYVPGGGPYYSSLASEVSAGLRQLVFNNRQLLILRLMRDFDLGDGCKLTLRAEPTWDLGRAHFDYNYQLYLNYQPGWFWGKR